MSNLDNHKKNGSYDVAVIGAGSAGFSAAITAVEQGAQVALIGEGTIGGTCVNVGCVPSKTMIRAAETLHQAKAADRFHGIEANARLTDWSAVMDQKDALVLQLRQGKYIDLLPSYNGVTYIPGRARLDREGVLVDGQLIKVANIIIATGSMPYIPAIKGINSVPYLTSTSALELDHLPQSMTILGGGYIGCELAQVFSRMGSRVTIVFRSRLVPESEPEISAALEGYFTDEGIKVQRVDAYDRVEKTDDGIALHADIDGRSETISARQLVITAGRKPNTNGLGLEDFGVGTLGNGGIKVDDHMQSTRRSVYAAGDVTGRDQFVYMAAYGAKIAAKNAMNGNALAYDNSAMPAVVFTDPQIAGVGATEAEARHQGVDVKTSILTLDNVPRALAARDMRGLIKLVADSKSNKLIGAHILAPEGADSIQTAAIAIKQGLSVQELGDMIFPYLTTVEGLKLAAQTFDKDVSKLSCCAG